MIVRVMFDGGRLRLELSPEQPLSAVMDAVVASAPHYRSGYLTREHPHQPQLHLVAWNTPIGQCLEHGEMLLANLGDKEQEQRDDEELDRLIGNPQNDKEATTEATQDLGGRTEVRAETQRPDARSDPTPQSRQGDAHRNEDAGEAMCRICHSGGDADGSHSRLISPCLCRGSVRFVHVDCLNEWRRLSINPLSYYECEQCHYRYSLRRAQWATLILSPRFVAVVSTVVCLVFTLFIATLLHFFSPNVSASELLYRTSRFVPWWRFWGAGVWLSIANGLNFVAAGVGGLGLIGFAVYLYDEYITHRNADEAVWNLLFAGVWLASLSNDRLARLVVIVGVWVSYRTVYRRVRHVTSLWSQTYGERILQVHHDE